MYIYGIDPGYTGAIAILDTHASTLKIFDMPVAKNTKGKTDLNMPALAEILLPWTHAPSMAVIEKVHAMPGQGVSSVFRFGECFGAIRMAVAGHRIPERYVSPAHWKKHFGLNRDKGVSRNLATQRFPNMAHMFKRVKDDGRAEAALLALYGQEKLMI